MPALSLWHVLNIWKQARRRSGVKLIEFEDNNRSVRARACALVGYGWGDPDAELRAASDRRRNMIGAMNTSPTMAPPRALKRKIKCAKRARVNSGSFEAVDGARSRSRQSHVMTYFRGLVADGLAEWRTMDDGTIRLCLSTGETYLLRKTTVTAWPDLTFRNASNAAGHRVRPFCFVPKVWRFLGLKANIGVWTRSVRVASMMRKTKE